MSSPNSSSSRSSSTKFKAILDNALNDYVKQTGVDLANYDFAQQLEGCHSTDEVLWLFREKAKQFKEYRDGNRKLINWISPVVQVVHVLSGFLGEAISAVSRHISDPVAATFERLITSAHFHQQKLFLLVSMFSSWYVPSLPLASGGSQFIQRIRRP
jgi:hypothetical protein